MSEFKLIFRFLNLVLPSSDPATRKFAKLRTPNDYNNGDYLDFEIEFSLCKLLESEIELYREFDSLKRDLSLRRDFNINNVFSYFDHDQNEFISYENLKVFFNENNVSVFEFDINFLINRLDIDKDGKIKFWEFQKLLSYNNYSNISAFKNEEFNQNLNSKSQLNFSQEHVFHNKTMKQVSHKPATHEFKDYSIGKSIQDSKIISKDDLKYEMSQEDQLFIDFLKEFMKYSTEVESIQKELCLKGDFTLQELYKLFEYENTEYLLKNDVKMGINLFEVYPTNDELKFLIHRFSTKPANDSKISFSSFCLMFIPMSQDHSNILVKRKPMNKEKITLSIFSVETKILIQSLFRLLISRESVIERWRQKFNSFRFFDLKSIFNKLDCSNKGFIIEDDIWKFFNFHRLNMKKEHVYFFFQMLDCDYKGKIYQNEFEDEFSPKSNEKYFLNF